MCSRLTSKTFIENFYFYPKVFNSGMLPLMGCQSCRGKSHKALCLEAGHLQLKICEAETTHVAILISIITDSLWQFNISMVAY